MGGPARLRGTFALAIAVSYLVVASLTFVAFVLSARSLMTGFATRFAATQALLEKNRILSRIDREVALAQKLVDDPVLVRWAKAEEDRAVKALAMQELESYRRVFAAHSYFLALDRSRHYYIFNSDPDVERLQVTTLSPTIPADAWYFETLRSVDSFALNVELRPHHPGGTGVDQRHHP